MDIGNLWAIVTQVVNVALLVFLGALGVYLMRALRIVCRDDRRAGRKEKRAKPDDHADAGEHQ